MKKRHVIRFRRAEGVEPMDPPPKTQSVVDSHPGHWCGGREREVKSEIFLIEYNCDQIVVHSSLSASPKKEE